MAFFLYFDSVHLQLKVDRKSQKSLSKQTERVLKNRFMLLVDNKHPHPEKWKSSTHIDLELHHQLYRIPDPTPTPLRPLYYRKRRHDDRLHDHAWFVPSPYSSCRELTSFSPRFSG